MKWYDNDNTEQMFVKHMKIYLCMTCQHLIASDDFTHMNGMPIGSFSRTTGANWKSTFSLTCPNCGSHCEYTKKGECDTFQYRMGNFDKTKITYSYDSVIHYIDFLKNISEKEKEELKSKVKEFRQKKYDQMTKERLEQEKKENDIIDKERKKRKELNNKLYIGLGIILSIILVYFIIINI